VTELQRDRQQVQVRVFAVEQEPEIPASGVEVGLQVPSDARRATRDIKRPAPNSGNPEYGLTPRRLTMVNRKRFLRPPVAVNPSLVMQIANAVNNFA